MYNHTRASQKLHYYLKQKKEYPFSHLQVPTGFKVYNSVGIIQTINRAS